MLPINLPVLLGGLLTCMMLEKFRLFGYGDRCRQRCVKSSRIFDDRSRLSRSRQDRLRLTPRGYGVWLIIALALHLAEVGLIGLSVIILATTFSGSPIEHAIGKAFTEALPVYRAADGLFAVVAVIIDQHLFAPGDRICSPGLTARPAVAVLPV